MELMKEGIQFKMDNLFFNYAAAYQQHAVTRFWCMKSKPPPVTIHIHLVTSDSEDTAGIITLCHWESEYGDSVGKLAPSHQLRSGGTSLQLTI